MAETQISHFREACFLNQLVNSLEHSTRPHQHAGSPNSALAILDNCSYIAGSVLLIWGAFVSIAVRHILKCFV
jgi:hypothetical protein